MIKRYEKRITVSEYVFRSMGKTFTLFENDRELIINGETHFLTKQENMLMSIVLANCGNVESKIVAELLSVKIDSISVIIRHIEKKIGTTIFKKYVHGKVVLDHE